MGVGAERPKTWGGSSQKLGRIDSWADRPVPRPLLHDSIRYIIQGVLHGVKSRRCGHL